MRLTYDELEDKIKGIIEEYDDHSYIKDMSVDVKKVNKDIFIKIRRMYEYVPFSFKILKEISYLTECEDIDVDQYQQDGCETCDYGSVYEVTFILKGAANYG